MTTYHVRSKISSSLYAMRKVKNILTTNHLLTLYYSLVYPYMDYGITLWGTSHKIHTNRILIMQKKYMTEPPPPGQLVSAQPNIISPRSGGATGRQPSDMWHLGNKLYNIITP